MAYDVGFIGFGEAARSFAGGWDDAGVAVSLAAYDILLDDPSAAGAMLETFRRHGVTAIATAAELAAKSDVVIAAVTADQVLAAARSVASITAPYLDINSAAPEKKKAAAALIGNSYVDVAVLSPVHPLRHQSPMLVGGPEAQACASWFKRCFPNAEIISTQVGEASLVKMIRSVFVKGLESITMECALAAYRSGLAERIFPSLDRVLRFTETKALADYTMERVAVHGLRRAAEMDEVCDTLADLGLPSPMSRGAAATQRTVGNMHLARDGVNLPEDAEILARAILTRLDDS